MSNGAADDAGDASEDRSLSARFLEMRDEAAFRTLYRRHARALYRFATRLSGGESAGDDLHQDTWIRAAEGLAGFRWDSSLRSWLCGIAVNRWREMTRARQREENGARDGAGRFPVPSSTEDARLDLERAILELPEGYREVFVLHDLYGYTHEEIAERLGIESGTSKSQLSRARGALRESLERPPGAKTGGER